MTQKTDKYTEQTAHTCPEYRNCHWYGCVFSPKAKEAIGKCIPVLLCAKCKPLIVSTTDNLQLNGHQCREEDCQVIHTFWSRENTYSSESLTMRRCCVCGQLWKVRQQWDSGTGNDDIWLKPGESRRGYEFLREETKLCNV